MTSYIGNFALWVSLFFSFLQFILSKNTNKFSMIKLNNILTCGILLAISLSFFSLMYSYLISDFSLKNVFLNSHTTKPLLYKITAVWGNHEGSMLLWMLVLALINLFICFLADKNNYILISKTLQIQSFINIGFLIFILFTSNPFEIIKPVPLNGLGFNPILQDPALAIHPPLLYIGYVGFSAAFSFSLATIILKNKSDTIWYKYMKPFVTLSWTFLTIGIAFGSIWAYYELGWGGWWFWDPVENAALMPWLLGTALLHSLITVEKLKSLQIWVLLLAILSFLLSITGTFLVRSGILTSVHTFALDPERGVYILIFITILGAYSLSMFAINGKYFANKKYFSFFTKQGAILINNIFMVLICASVFVGTVYPLFIEIFTNKRISVGEPYFNSTLIPIMIAPILIMGIVPFLTWNTKDINKNIKNIIPGILLTLTIIFIFFLKYNSHSLFGFIGIILSSWIITNILINLIQKIQKFIKQKKTNYNPISMILSHFGIGLLIIGITASSIWQDEKIVRIKLNEEIKIKNYKIIFKEIKKVNGSNYLSQQGVFFVYNNKDENIAVLKPENRFYPVTNTATTEASINTSLIRDLYLVLGSGNINDGWIVRAYYNPLVIWIWIGVFITFIGGIFSLFNNLKSLKK